MPIPHRAYSSAGAESDASRLGVTFKFRARRLPGLATGCVLLPPLLVLLTLLYLFRTTFLW